MTVILLKFSILWVVATWILLNFGMIFNAENDKDDKTLVDIEEYVPSVLQGAGSYDNALLSDVRVYGYILFIL